ncbi:hypothetical protein [uncultured Marinobacter sp.]|jgi:hypothetical protein|uniref:hypothetical protein n=1 Tax=uncultured Marinobacter sp. TaxID=187379 RepID=UPI000C0AE47D|nr:hypothetical protein [Marinobacter sp.]MBI43425.1 hypothetical protein [Oceanospirillales bacterium]|tara:strand:- start:4199 stop:4567 length:369 start_codon:yes stop_codon:yes gene_type:complete
MNTLAPQRSWLLDPDLLKLVHQCRRLIHSEFGVKLHLTEDHLEQRLADYASKSRSSHLLRTWEALKSRVPELDVETDEAEIPKRVYRGQVLDDGPAKTAADPVTEEKPQPKKKIIYRGRVVG